MMMTKNTIKAMVAAMAEQTKMYVIDKKDVIFPEDNKAVPFRGHELMVVSHSPINEEWIEPILLDDKSHEILSVSNDTPSFSSGSQDYGNRPLKSLSLTFEGSVDADTLAKWNWEYMCQVAPWVKRNFVKETITHKIEY